MAATFLLALTPGFAEAQAGSRVCRQLQAQITATLPRSTASPAQIRNYDNAIVRQQDQIAKARVQIRRAGCGFAIFGRSVAQCGELNATLARMETNLAQLQKMRNQLGIHSSRKREHARILAALDANDCHAPQKPSRREAQAETTAASTETRRPHSVAGNLRTLCVRSCDGYFFPLSWSVSQAAFERDERNCQTICPGTKVTLHYHRIAGEEPEDMVSVATGLPYRDSENAFLYKQKNAAIPADCSCGTVTQATSSFKTIGGDYSSNAAPGAGDSAKLGADDGAVTASLPRPRPSPSPSPRPDPAEIPETLAAHEDRLDADSRKKLATPPVPSASQPPAQSPDQPPIRRQIRVVGPTFFHD